MALLTGAIFLLGLSSACVSNHLETHSVTNETGPRLWLHGPDSMGRHGAGFVTEDLETPRRGPSASTYVPAPSRINWVTGGGACTFYIHGITIAGVASRTLPRPSHQARRRGLESINLRFLRASGGRSPIY
jgi:hypothetical protein